MTVRGGRGPRDAPADPVGPSASTGHEGYRRTGRYGQGPGDQRRYERYGSRGGGLGGLLRFLLFVGVLAAGVLLTLATVARPVLRMAIAPWAEQNPGAFSIGFVAELVREDLGAALTSPASSDPTTVMFTVSDGDTPASLAPRLYRAGLIASQPAFLLLAREQNLAPQLTVGTFELARNLTPGQVVQGLIANKVVAQTVSITFREGLRIEQMTAKLETVAGTRIDPQAFEELAVHPPEELLADYPWLLDPKIRAKGSSLEGFLYPATYEVRVDPIAPTDAEGLVRMMLDAFYTRVGADRMAVPTARGLTFQQVLVLASIVEKEAVLPDEMPLIAGVYQNRLDRIPAVRTGLLQADPTVIYAVDTVRLGAYSDAWQSYTFWTVPDGGMQNQKLPDALAAYNTYLVPGLPPGPICSPTVASIDAALAPDTKTRYAFFVAIPGGGGKHDFSKTLAEHQAKLRKYGY